MPESTIVAKILNNARKHGAIAEKMHGSEYMRKGYHDIQIGYQGYYVGVEAKKDPWEQMSVAQKQVQKEARAADCVHICTWRWEDVDLIFQMIREGTRPQAINEHIDREQEKYRDEHRGRRRIYPKDAVASH